MEQQKFSIIQLNWSLAEFNHYICQCYPQVSLNLVGFELARADRGKKLQKVHVASVMELKMAIGKSRLYLIPLAEVYQESGSPEPEDPRRYTNITETIEERRALRQQQDDEFNASLLADREREMRRQILETQEERRLQVIQERRQRISFPEPSDGVPLRFKFPNGQLKTRRFLLSESIQRLFDFVGQDNSSTEIFSIREATSGVQIGSNTMSGSIEDHNITGFSTLYIMWTASPEEEVPPHMQMTSSTSPPQTSATSITNPNASSPPHTSAALSTNSDAPLPPCMSASSPPRTSAPSALLDTPSPPRTSAPSALSDTPSPPRTSAPLPTLSYGTLPPGTSAVSPYFTYQDDQWSPAPSPSGSPEISGSHWSPSPTSPSWSPISVPTTTLENDCTETQLKSILIKLVSRVDFTSCPTTNQINVSRDRIFHGSVQAFKRRRFDPAAKLDIVFVDNEGVSEGAVDEGGPSREYFRLLMKDIQQSKIFEGPEQKKNS
ncbi:uncharacterized protein [Pseudorasbora parva]|uniref:uncharacterized protein isoform X1 n=1 Tax=Pseudorasbora parva TaxID=51549 RepID=UPI00351F730F